MSWDELQNEMNACRSKGIPVRIDLSDTRSYLFYALVLLTYVLVLLDHYENCGGYEEDFLDGLYKHGLELAEIYERNYG